MSNVKQSHYSPIEVRLLISQKAKLLISYSLLFFSLLLFLDIVIVGEVGNFSFYKKNINLFKVLESYSMTLFLCLILPTRNKKPSDFLLHLHFIIPLLPMLVLYGYSDFSRSFIYLCFFFFSLLIVLADKLKIPSIRLTNIPTKSFEFLLLSISTIVVYSFVERVGYSALNFNLLDVYDFRSDEKNTMPVVFNYFMSNTSKVIIPFLILSFVLSRKWIFLVFTLVLAVLLFGATGQKSILFLPFITLATIRFLNSRDPIYLMCISFFLLTLLCIIIFLYTDGFLQLAFSSLTIRRALFEPSLINNFYYDFFSNNGFIYWSNSSVSLGMMDYPYDIGPAYMIGRYYMFGDLNGANTGWLASGYMQAGILGMLIYTFLFGILLATLNSFARRSSKSFITALALPPFAFLMASSDLPVTMLNHGIVFLLLLLSMSIIRSDSSSILRS